MPPPIHLIETNYPKGFPPSVDVFPTLTDREHYIDAWHFNTIFNSLTALETYLIEFRANIEAPIGNDIIGDDGQSEIPIPPGRYPSYRAAMAWDSELLSENIKSGVNIFGVSGALEAGGNGVDLAKPGTLNQPDMVVYENAPTQAIDTSRPTIAAPTVTAA
jgi:hypothetical protein